MPTCSETCINRFRLLSGLYSIRYKRGQIINPSLIIDLLLCQYVKISNPEEELDYNNPTKNDTKDARVIAQLVKDGRQLLRTLHSRELLQQDLVRIEGPIYK